MQIQPLRGTRNLYPKDMRERQVLTDACRSVLQSAGYEEYEAPILESMALYEAKSSAEIVERQSYVFTDRGGEKIVVRPELTPSFARMVANKQGELPSLIRWFSFPECWRYERPQKGRTRNFLQINVDFLGSDTVEADVEVIDIALSMMKKIGLDMKNIRMLINDRASFDALCEQLSVEAGKRGKFLTLLDERDKLQPEEFITRLQEINPNLREDDLVALDNMRASPRLLSVIAAAESLGWTQLVYDPKLMRGFSYYTGIVFEVVETSGTFNRAVFGGGRYDNLLEDVGGRPMSGIGFAVSDV
ncbi:histidine--tRNA ligase, partial [bacterium]|nr:histidine--tRNA ligase [bacterium]